MTLASTLYVDVYLNVGGTLAISDGGYLWFNGDVAQADVAFGPAVIHADAITISAQGTLAAETGTIEANVTDSGVLAIGTSLAITGSLTLQSSVTLGQAETLNVGGSLSLGSGGALDVAGGTLVAGTLAGSGTILLGYPATASGPFAVSTTTIDAIAGSPTVEFGAGQATLTVLGTGTLGLVVENFQQGIDAIDFVSVSSTPTNESIGDSVTMSDGTLDVVGASGETATLVASINGGTASGSVYFGASPDGTGGTLVTASSYDLACYVAGTRILAEHGEVAIEMLRPGDTVRTLSGRLAPVRWIGWTRIDLTRHADPERAAPIRIQAGAIAPGLPRRDLLVSRDHALLLDGALVPVWRLANGASIARQDGLASVLYIHVELDRHDILLAEGVAAESYLDTGNRGQFANDTGPRTLHPDFATAPDEAALRIWAEHGAAPLLLDVDAVAGRHANLVTRAEGLGWTRTDDPWLTIVTNGAILPARRVDGLTWRARLPAGTTALRLRSASFIPAEQEADSGDGRRLGIAVAALLVGGRPLPPTVMGEGFHPAEANWRWTDGDAVVSVPPRKRAATLEVRLAFARRYWRPAHGGEAVALSARRTASA